MKYVMMTTPKPSTTEESESSTAMAHTIVPPTGHIRPKIKCASTSNSYGYEIYDQDMEKPC